MLTPKQETQIRRVMNETAHRLHWIEVTPVGLDVDFQEGKIFGNFEFLGTVLYWVSPLVFVHSREGIEDRIALGIAQTEKDYPKSHRAPADLFNVLLQCASRMGWNYWYPEEKIVPGIVLGTPNYFHKFFDRVPENFRDRH